MKSSTSGDSIAEETYLMLDGSSKDLPLTLADISGFSHWGNPLYSGTLYPVSITGDPEESIFLLKNFFNYDEIDVIQNYKSGYVRYNV